MKKIIILIFLIIIAVSTYFLTNNKSFKEKDDEIKKPPKEYLSPNEALIDNNYTFNNNIYTKIDSTNEVSITFKDDSTSNYKICENGDTESCITYYWELNRVSRHFCAYDYDTKMTSTIENHCSNKQINELVNFKKNFIEYLGSMQINLDDLNEIKAGLFE